MSFAVTVRYQIDPNQFDPFTKRIVQFSAAALEKEAGCLRCDVATDARLLGEVFLYKIFENRAAYEAHLMTPHYRECDAATAGMIRTKVLQTYSRVIS